MLKMEIDTACASWPNACATFAPAGKQMLWREIFVKPQPKQNSSPVGEAYSDDFAPTELLKN
jgi:hypothetical protein